jgi:hypothetical protein
MQFSPTSRHFISLWSKYSPQHPVLKHPQVICLLTFLNTLDIKKITNICQNQNEHSAKECIRTSAKNFSSIWNITFFFN